MNKMNIRPLTVMVLFFFGVSSLVATADELAEKPYRVIFNCDEHSVFNYANGSAEAYIRNVFGSTENANYPWEEASSYERPDLAGFCQSIQGS